MPKTAAPPPKAGTNAVGLPPSRFAFVSGLPRIYIFALNLRGILVPKKIKVFPSLGNTFIPFV